MSKVDEYINKGKEYFDEENYEESIKYCNLAIESEPNNLDLYYYRAVCYANMGKFSDAIPDFSKSIESAPENAQCWGYRGNCYFEIGEYDKAIYDYNKAIELELDNPIFYYDKALCELNLKKYDEALRNFNKAELLNPQRYNDAEKYECSKNILYYGKYLADYITDNVSCDYCSTYINDLKSIRARRDELNNSYKSPNNSEEIYKEVIKALYKLYVDFIIELEMASDNSVLDIYGEIVDLFYIKFYSFGRVSIYTGARNNTDVIPSIDIKQYIPVEFFDIPYEQLDINNDNKYKMIFDELMSFNESLLNGSGTLVGYRDVENIFKKIKDIIVEIIPEVQLMLDIERLFRTSLWFLCEENDDEIGFEIDTIYRDSKLDSVRCKIIENIENGLIKTIKDARRYSYLWLEEENNSNLNKLNDSEKQFKKYCDVADSHYIVEEYEDAIIYYKKALEIKYDSDIYETVADYYHELKQYEKEISHYESILSTRFVPWIYKRYVNCYYEQQEYVKAIEICNRAIQEAPELLKADAYCDRGEFKEKINDYKGALIDYKKALELNPESIIANKNIEKFKDWLKYREIDTKTMNEILALLSSEKVTDIVENNSNV